MIAAGETIQVEPAQPHGENQLQQRSKEEGGQRNTGQSQHRNDIVCLAVLLGGGNDAQGDRDDDLQHEGDDEYFSHMVLDDLNLIIRDIREAHKKDSESAPQTTVADELKENLEAVENFKGSRDEKLVVLYCKQLGINYKNLSDEEFRWLIRILKKSKKMGTPISQRKKR